MFINLVDSPVESLTMLGCPVPKKMKKRRNYISRSNNSRSNWPSCPRWWSSISIWCCETIGWSKPGRHPRRSCPKQFKSGKLRSHMSWAGGIILKTLSQTLLGYMIPARILAAYFGHLSTHCLVTAPNVSVLVNREPLSPRSFVRSILRIYVVEMTFF